MKKKKKEERFRVWDESRMGQEKGKRAKKKN